MCSCGFISVNFPFPFVLKRTNWVFFCVSCTCMFRKVVGVNDNLLTAVSNRIIVRVFFPSQFIVFCAKRKAGEKLKNWTHFELKRKEISSFSSLIFEFLNKIVLFFVDERQRLAKSMNIYHEISFMFTEFCGTFPIKIHRKYFRCPSDWLVRNIWLILIWTSWGNYENFQINGRM